MVAPKCPGSEVRAEYQRGFGVPTLIAVHPERRSGRKRMGICKSILCWNWWTQSWCFTIIFCCRSEIRFNGRANYFMWFVTNWFYFFASTKWSEKGIDIRLCFKINPDGWEVVTEALKQGGITAMMDRLSNPAKIKA
jgi:ketol-acid reductoisomerase